ncbi:hypothetical protein MSG28_015232 [Choristoneura fumiferana]|uniref:Uncharacterized protein n=1 Tax=Choristoneura fumiferana TaxID=7141 RepID=A0ACC0KZE3_CHOFU|nr:hypothetical protein MSG28_015232 [Choristoneura fumiferana]
MEDVYTIKVKTKPDTRNLYPSERRYSASTVSGLAWVHLALAATSFLLACLALVNPHSDIKRMTLNDTEEKIVNTPDLLNLSESSDLENTTNGTVIHDSSYILVLAPSLITVFATAAGIASIMASVRWYIDRNITWLFIMSIISTLMALTSFVMIITWFVVTSDMDFSEFYKDKIPFKDQLVIKHTDVLVKNETHMLIALNNDKGEDDSYVFTKRVLSINIMIAAFLEILWSILSVKISYKGMKTDYKDDSEPRGNCIAVVTTIKGNNTKKLPRNAKILPPKPDLIDHYPSKKIKRIYLAQSDEGFYLKNQQKDKANPNSEMYNDRVMNFLNRCDSESNEITPSVHSEALNTIPEATNAQLNQERDQSTPISWGDSLDHTIYNQNNINFEKIFNFGKQEESKVKMSENV